MPRHDWKLPKDLRNLWLTWIIVACLLSLVLMLTGCATGDRKSKTLNHALVCFIFCIDVDMQHESDIKEEKGGTPKDAAPTSLDGLMLTPEQRDHSRAGSPAHSPVPRSSASAATPP